MKKLNKRQIIILSITGLFVLYAVYALLITPAMDKKVKTQAKPVTIETFVNQISGELMSQKMIGVDAYIARSAEIEWGKSPFWEKVYYREFVGYEKETGSQKIIYSGFLDIGTKKLAIINGWEYEKGESLDIEGYVLKSIAPSRIVITNRNTGGELIIPIQE